MVATPTMAKKGPAGSPSCGGKGCALTVAPRLAREACQLAALLVRVFSSNTFPSCEQAKKISLDLPQNETSG